MNFLRSVWFLAILALLLNMGTLGGMWFVAQKQLKFTPAKKAKEKDVLTSDEVPWDMRTKEMDSLVNALIEERRKIAKREAAVSDAEARIRTEREELQRLRKEIEESRRELMGKVQEIESVESKNLKGLAKTFAGMRPDEAVEVLSTMPDNSVVRILAFMAPGEQGAIIENMAKKSDAQRKRAGAIVEKLRLYLPPKKDDKG